MRNSTFRLLLIMLILLSTTACSEQPIVWSVFHVSGSSQSGDAHLLQFPSGKNILIDTGFARYTKRDLLPALQERNITTIDTVLITHAHRNHYGGLKQLIKPFNIQTVYFNLPPTESCAKEQWSTGCNLAHVVDTHKYIQEHATLLPIKSGEIIFQDKELDISLEALYSLDSSKPVLPGIGVNDASAVFKLTYGKSSVLFTGDIGTGAGQHLADHHDPKLQSTAMTAPHHGVTDTAPNNFFDQVKPKLVVASISKRIWLSDRGRQTREYFQDKNTPIYVTGEIGHFDINITNKTVTVQP